MSCLNGVCSPTAKDAVLYYGDLQTLLGSGNVSVTTTGSGVQANDIEVKAPFGWLTTTLTLDAHRSIKVERPMSVTAYGASGGLTLTTNDGGSGGVLWFKDKGRAEFTNLSSSLVINGASYTLVANVKTLAADIAANPSGDYALANDYRAWRDGIYRVAAVPTIFNGNFEGLGNTITGLSITSTGKAQAVGMFAQIATGGAVENFNLWAETVVAISRGRGDYVGGLAGYNAGTLFADSVDGFVEFNLGDYIDYAGGLVGANGGAIDASHSTATVESLTKVSIGGLVGNQLAGAIINSYATGPVEGGSYGGGLVGVQSGGAIGGSFATGDVKTRSGSVGGLVGVGYQDSVSNCYSLGAVTGGKYYTGGFLGIGGYGQNGGSVGASYSAGAVSGFGYVGGYAGLTANPDNTSDAYWDTVTSGTQTGVGYGSSEGITGETTQQLQSGLPAGFDPTIWAENSNINGGLPYLIANPPPK